MQTQLKGITWVENIVGDRLEVTITMPMVDPIPEDIVAAFKQLKKVLEPHELQAQPDKKPPHCAMSVLRQ